MTTLPSNATEAEREARRKYDREWKARFKAEQPDKQLDGYLRSRYGIDLVRYNEILLSQNGHCALCSTTIDTMSSGRLAVDHDHTCCPGLRSCGKCVRGLLCRPCNTALGMMGDSPEKLEAAARYLRTAAPN